MEKYPKYENLIGNLNNLVILSHINHLLLLQN